MTRQASAKYYKKIKIKIFLKKRKTKRENMVMKDVKISQKMKNKR